MEETKRFSPIKYLLETTKTARICPKQATNLGGVIYPHGFWLSSHEAVRRKCCEIVL